MRNLFCLLVWAAFALAASAEDAFRISPLFGSHACFQADRPLAIWGWAPAGEKVTVAMGDSRAETTTGPDGRWQVELPAIKAGGPYALTAQCGERKIQSDDIVAGEVWLASGQSNMFWPLARTGEGEKDIPAAQDPQLRFFRVEVTPSKEPLQEPSGRWTLCTPETAKDFSGVAYYFGRALRKDLKRPVGLIQTALGGTPIEGWLAPDTWGKEPGLEELRKIQEGLADDHMRKKYERVLEAWKKRGSPADKEPPAPDYSDLDQNDPSVCFNAGIAPVAPFPVAGFLWYQGEWNASRPEHYGRLLKVLITQWRRLWKEGELPFYVVQLPGIGKTFNKEPVQERSGWAGLREAQLAARELPKADVAVTIDLGGDLHPPRKREVGERLALLALSQVYEKPVAAHGPIFCKAKRDGAAVKVAFEHADGLKLQTEGGPSGFALAGEDNVFHTAEARIEGDAVVLSSSAVSAPKSVRYLWAQNPRPTLYNSAHLPAGPFRVDLAK